ncbi:MAG: UxaA family hydrolase, partial [Pedobacter sp.]|nr:UxaA family hydrolase [Pedobacter sp.]
VLAALKDLIPEMDTLFEGSSVIIKDKIPAKHKVFIIDIDTGAIICCEKSIPEMGEDILELCIKVASDEMIPKAVALNQDDFILWKREVSL